MTLLYSASFWVAFFDELFHVIKRLLTLWWELGQDLIVGTTVAECITKGSKISRSGCQD